MALIKSTRTPYLAIDPATKVIHWTGSLWTGPVKYPFRFIADTYKEQELMAAFFPAYYNAPTTVQVRAMGAALRGKLNSRLNKA